MGTSTLLAVESAEIVICKSKPFDFYHELGYILIQ